MRCSPDWHRQSKGSGPFGPAHVNTCVPACMTRLETFLLGALAEAPHVSPSRLPLCEIRLLKLSKGVHRQDTDGSGGWGSVSKPLSQRVPLGSHSSAAVAVFSLRLYALFPLEKPVS